MMGAFSIWHWALVLLIVVANFLPAIIAFRRYHPSRFWILLVNIVLGWTGIGWVVALIWAMTGPRAPAAGNLG